MNISMDKKYERHGEPVEVLTVTRSDIYSVVVMVPNGNIRCLTSEGYLHQGDRAVGIGPHITEVKPTRWVNVYKCEKQPKFYIGNINLAFTTKEAAFAVGNNPLNYIATIPITFDIPAPK